MAGDVLPIPIDILAPADSALQAVESVFRVHAVRMKSIAYNLLGNQPDAEDAVQEAFLRSCRSRDAFRNQASLHTWVYRILINLCVDEGRRRRRTPWQNAGTETESPQTGADVRAALRQALDRLPVRQRTVFLMAAVEGLPHAEIAAILEISETNSRTLLLDARRELQTILRA
ncbi:MAG TPA: RNA polymerase sigma factor [Bryobacteraceae bacterium]|nr:RNA polymerase sigma factor [Bryobacteraceae bacterium]